MNVRISFVCAVSLSQSCVTLTDEDGHTLIGSVSRPRLTATNRNRLQRCWREPRPCAVTRTTTTTTTAGFGQTLSGIQDLTSMDDCGCNHRRSPEQMGYGGPGALQRLVY
ncbi:hypothetical protein FQA47_024472 [Oryzias melastigma]|uniref:Uncharacterized protein n=1 Tax=Oryzias melastigma TaxID=30732 RepID=A0A834BNN6_ORYME|nr:hypothetical protein FQA47_024472 [Oryzias melastigma]